MNSKRENKQTHRQTKHIIEINEQAERDRQKSSKRINRQRNKKTRKR
jgi:hypothetical protein